MNDLYRQLRSDYIDALRLITPEILHWWSDNCLYHWTDGISDEEMTDFHRRWPFGPAAGEQDYVTLVTCMPYWPIGLDEHGEWN